MRQNIEFTNRLDGDRNPTGGNVEGAGITITWQDGPLGRGESRKEPNGAFVEGVIQAAIQRLEFYQESKFKCETNAKAIENLKMALSELDNRTKDREERKVEGENKV